MSLLIEGDNDVRNIKHPALPDGITVRSTTVMKFGACNFYEVLKDGLIAERLNFQIGPNSNCELAGVREEALLAIVLDRLETLNNGNSRCRENSIAATHIEEAMLWLHQRTGDLKLRNVEGTTDV